MDGKLFEAAIGGNTEMLLELLQVAPPDPQAPPDPPDWPAINLDRIMSECKGKDNPLHVGALYGHVQFVTEILSKKPELTRELNSEGQSPLHLASARGHVEVVNAILSKDVDHDACLIRDGDGMIPLHLAAIKGRLDVLETLVQAKKVTAFILTKSGEPILHLCANNNKFKALKKLVEMITDDNFLNLKDSDDNTILHVLSDKSQPQLIRLLVQKGTVDVNAVNIHGYMPLDVSIGNSKGPSEWCTDFYLINAGAKRSVPIFGIGHYWMIGGWFNEALLVVAILLVSVAFQAAMNPPGGVWQDTGYHNATLPNAPQSSPPELVYHYAGQSVMSRVDPETYKSFSDFNELTIFSSVLAIVLLLKECFVKSLFHKFLAIAFTFASLLTMWAAYSVSLLYISSCAINSTNPVVVMFPPLVFMLLVIIIPPNFHVVCFETLRFASGHCRTTSVQARAVGRP